MSTSSITLSCEQVDSIVVDELMFAYKINTVLPIQETELLRAIETLLAYYMPPVDYVNWKMSIESQEENYA
jgi:hypothetical protein